MCDTLIATKLATANGVPIFAKNSDRQPNESQYIAYFPAATHAPNSRLKCTYIEVPQAEKTKGTAVPRHQMCGTSSDRSAITWNS